VYDAEVDEYACYGQIVRGRKIRLKRRRRSTCFASEAPCWRSHGVRYIGGQICNFPFHVSYFFSKLWQ
jgi:hypothetical protein